MPEPVTNEPVAAPAVVTRTRRYRLPGDRATAIRSDPPAVMNLMEASAYLTCSPRKLREFVATHRIRHARVGAKIIFRRGWLDAFIDR